MPNNDYQKLRECPFCGGKANTHACAEFDNDALKIIYGGNYGVHCSECNVATRPYPLEELAIEAWNKRYTPYEEIDFDYGAECE